MACIRNYTYPVGGFWRQHRRMARHESMAPQNAARHVQIWHSAYSPRANNPRCNLSVEMEMNNITAQLFALQDKTYGDFQSKLIPTVPRETIIGVRTPDLRKMAKQISRAPSAQAFLQAVPHRYFDENQLHAFILSEEKDFEACVAELERFLPYIDNWATCDQLSPRCFKRHTQELIPHIRRWMSSSRTYTKRFGILTLMRYFLDKDFRPEHLEWVSSIRSDEYYIRMMQAWFFATALAKQWEATLPYIRQRRLDSVTHGKTIQKAIESFRLTPEQKQILRTH